MFDKYVVSRFDYSGIDKIFSISAENPETNHGIKIGIEDPDPKEITNAITKYNERDVALNHILSCFDI